MNQAVTADFTEFFESEAEPLLRMCWALTLDRELAQDVTQETMTRAWRDWDRLGMLERAAGPTTSSAEPARDQLPRAWCRTVALNLIRGNWRRQQTERSARLAPPEPAGLDASDLDLRDALAELSDRQREAVVLHHLLDLPVRQCAEVLGVGESTVKAHLQRGRAQLLLRLDAPVSNSERN